MRNLKAIVLALGLLGCAQTFREPLPANHTTRMDCLTVECLADLSRRGNALFDNGSFQDALPLLEAANRSAAALGTKREQSLIAVRIGRIYQTQGHKDKALESYREASALADELNDDRLRAEALLGKAAFEYSQANLPSALKEYEKCLQLTEDDPALAAKAEAGIGLIHYARGNYDRALSYYTESLRKEEAISNRDGICRMSINLGTVYTKLEDYARALAYFQQSLQSAQKLQSKALTASALTNIGVVRHLSENLKESLDYYKKAEAIHIETGNSEGLLAILIRIGQVHFALEELDPSMQYYERALKLAKHLDHRHLGWIYQSIGELMAARGQFTEALAYLHQALDCHVRMGQTEQQARDLASLATAYEGLGDVTNALSSARRAGHLASSIRSKKTQWDAYCIEGDVLQSTGKIPESAHAYGKAIRAIEEVRANVSNWDVDQQTFFESRLKPYQEIVRIQLGKGRFSLALAYAEMAKARSLLDLMHRRRGAGTLAQPLSGGPELTETSAGARGKWLDRGTVVIEYLVMKDGTLAFVLSGKSGNEPKLHTFSINVAKGALLEKSRLFRQALEERRANFYEPARELYDWLVKPAAAQLEGQDAICFIPDSGLWDLPFQALISSDGRFLLEQHAVFYAPSIAGLRALNERAARTSRSVPPSLFAMGNPTPSETSIVPQESSYRGLTLGALPEAETEVRSIAQGYGAKALVLVGQAANEETLKREASRYRILHFATHGVLDNLNPMRSYLLLSPGQGSDIDDGKLDAQEMMNLNLDVDLTVLAACQTGRGKVRNGEGLLGMSWALFAAGCPSTIASQWKVDSASTMKLMIDLHQNLQSGGVTKARALQSAALKVKQSSLYRHPHYWAPFILIGANSSPQLPANLSSKTKGGELNESPNKAESRIEPAGRGSTGRLGM